MAAPLQMSSRKEQFWQAVEQSWAQKFDAGDISRVLRFEKYCKQELEVPEPIIPYHQPCEEYVEDLEASAFWENSRFDWVTRLEAESDMIQEEFAQYLVSVGDFKGDSAVMSAMGPGWSSVRLQRLGRWNLENCARFPKTVKLLEELEIPLAVRGVMFARQLPGTGVQPHSDGRNFILTAHLGIEVPEDCWIKVGGEKRTWENGKTIVFDTSFEHSTFNEADTDRVVLIIDFWHPGLTPKEKEALEVVYELRNEFDSGKYIQGYATAKEKNEVTSAFDSFRNIFNKK